MNRPGASVARGSARVDVIGLLMRPECRDSVARRGVTLKPTNTARHCLYHRGHYFHDTPAKVSPWHILVLTVFSWPWES